MSVSLTENAARQIKKQLEKRGKGIGLKLGVKKSGCSGYAYVLDYADTLNEDDAVFEKYTQGHPHHARDHDKRRRNTVRELPDQHRHPRASRPEHAHFLQMVICDAESREHALGEIRMPAEIPHRIIRPIKPDISYEK